MVGLDTAYFIGIMQGQDDILGHWRALKARAVNPYVSVLTLGEILYLTIRLGRPDQGRKMIGGIESIAHIIDINRPIVERAAGLKGGKGIPFIDSLIIASFLEFDCREIHTKDRSHFADIGDKKTRVIFW